MMFVSAITPSRTPPIYQNGLRQDLQAVQSALKAGDVEKAQQAFIAFKNDFHATHHGRALFQTHVPVAIQDDLRSLQAALKAGDLAGAQLAFVGLRQDMTRRLQHTDPPEVQPPQSTGDSSGVDVVA
jgi:hypothetical protein